MKRKLGIALAAAMLLALLGCVAIASTSELSSSASNLRRQDCAICLTDFSVGYWNRFSFRME